MKTLDVWHFPSLPDEKQGAAGSLRDPRPAYVQQMNESSQSIMKTAVGTRVAHGQLVCHLHLGNAPEISVPENKRMQMPHKQCHLGASALYPFAGTSSRWARILLRIVVCSFSKLDNERIIAYKSLRVKIDRPPA